MFGEKACELIKELKRADGSTLPVYNEDLIRQVLEEMSVLFAENQKEVNAIAASEKGLHSGVQLRHISLERNKRCILAYVYNRMLKLKNYRWECGGVLPNELRQNLCDNEAHWFTQYNKTLAKYMQSVGGVGGIDLTLDSKPPTSLLIEVRCLTDYGEFQTDDGQIILLVKDSQHFLPRTQCERLIRQGILEHATT